MKKLILSFLLTHSFFFSIYSQNAGGSILEISTYEKPHDVILADNQKLVSPDGTKELIRFDSEITNSEDIGIFDKSTGDIIWRANMTEHNLSIGRLAINKSGLKVLSTFPIYRNLWSQSVEDLSFVSRFWSFMIFGTVSHYFTYYLGLLSIPSSGFFVVGGTLGVITNSIVGPAHYYFANISNEGNLEIYSTTYDSYLDVFSSNERPKILRWSSKTGNEDRLLFEDMSLRDYLINQSTGLSDKFNKDFDNVIYDSNDTKPRLISISNNDNVVFLNGNTHRADDFNGNHFDEDEDEVTILNNLGFNFTSDFYIAVKDGIITAYDFNNTILEQKDFNCIKIAKGDDGIYSSRYRILQNNNTDIELLNGESNILLVKKASGYSCTFPSTGQSELITGQKLVQYDLSLNLDEDQNKINYLLSEDKQYLTIKHEDVIKVIKKEDFNGNFQTTPTYQTFNLQ